MARALAARLGKRVDVRVEGRGVPLRREVAGALADALVHLLRNAVDHGVEPPAERSAAGKPPAGRVRIAARAEGADVVLEVHDDGRGLDAAALRAAAARAGVPGGAATALALRPGVSTAPAAGAVSGRGVGLDAVRCAARALGGSVELTSAPGTGTTVAIRVPAALRGSTPAPLLTRE
jgi:two-component system chemotaxis sensor kinase CheA